MEGRKQRRGKSGWKTRNKGPSHTPGHRPQKGPGIGVCSLRLVQEQQGRWPSLALSEGPSARGVISDLAMFSTKS